MDGNRGKAPVSLSNAEWKIMQVMWEKGTCTLQDLMDGLTDTDWDKQLVLTLLKRMTVKGTVLAETRHRPGKYTSLLDKEEALAMETDFMLERVYNNDLMSMLTHAIQGRNLSPEDIAALKAMLENR